MALLLKGMGLILNYKDGFMIDEILRFQEKALFQTEYLYSSQIYMLKSLILKVMI